ncbi:hypothetical protein PoMZ_08471 [Pyricularia oryzae]|uniref:Uncharacterized protein n=1 Tax=Pyricularia oryzae TaxID=318829 RepID=A0A4P7NHP1_PYROR|nr:hypothetical protein PoMZ_08471 [Pyricularia oryzae]
MDGLTLSPSRSLLSRSLETLGVSSVDSLASRGLRRLDGRASWYNIVPDSGVSERPKFAILCCAAVAAPRIPRVRAVPTSWDMAGESGAESSLSSESDRSPSRNPFLRPPGPGPAGTLLYSLLSSTLVAAPGSTEDTTSVRTVR